MQVSERSRIAAREFRKEYEAAEAAERAQREKPLREAEQQLNRTARELAEMERKNILALKDEGFTVPASVIGKRMYAAEAIEFNAIESRKFMESTPDYFPCDKNFQTIIDYLQRNGIHIADAATFRSAYERLRSVGLLEERPVPEPTPEIATVPALEPEPSKQEAQTFEGFDPDTGNPRTYTSREIDRMSSLEYKKAFRLCGDKLPVFIPA